MQFGTKSNSYFSRLQHNLLLFSSTSQVSLLQTCSYPSHKGHRAALRPKTSNHLLALLQHGALLSTETGPPHREELPLHQPANPAAVGNHSTGKVQLLSRIFSCSPLRSSIWPNPQTEQFQCKQGGKRRELGSSSESALSAVQAKRFSSRATSKLTSRLRLNENGKTRIIYFPVTGEHC